MSFDSHAYDIRGVAGEAKLATVETLQRALEGGSGDGSSAALEEDTAETESAGNGLRSCAPCRQASKKICRETTRRREHESGL